MKVAVSIPDDVFAEGERLAQRLKSSRSEIYARALAEFVGTHAPEHVTEALDAVIEAVGAESHEFTRAAARQVLDRVEW